MAVDVKICGLTNREDAIAAMSFGADYLGFILYEGSPRRVATGQLVDIMRGDPKIRNAVGVFVNASREEVEHVIIEANLDVVQLHGDEDADAFKGLAVPTWRAIKIRGGQCVPALEEWDVDRYVIDADVCGKFGGTGVEVDREEAAMVAARCSAMLAGGLTPDNVAEAITRVRPVGVDVSSGVESEPCKKDLDKVEAFIRAAKKI